MPKKSSNPVEPAGRRVRAARLPSGRADRKRQFRETARDILHSAKVKRQFGEAVDTAGAIASAMERAYRLGAKEALQEPAAPDAQVAATPQ